MKEIEYYSKCCIAPPLYELNDYLNDEFDFLLGICMKCREKAVFDVFGDEDPYEPIIERSNNG